MTSAPDQSQAADHVRLLPGLTARHWERIANWAFGIGLLLLASEFVLFVIAQYESTFDFRVFAPWLVLPALVLLLFARLMMVVRNPRSRAEERSGYTTLSDRNPNLAYVDYRTGRVLRPAGPLEGEKGRIDLDAPPSTGTSNQAQVTTGIALAFTPGFPPERHPSTRVYGIIAAVIAALVIFALFGTVKGWATGLLVVAGLGVVTAVTIALAGIVWRAQNSSGRSVVAWLRQARPGSLVFAAGSSNDLAIAGERLGARQPLKGILGVTADPGGIQLWSPRREAAILDIPWAAIQHVEAATVGSPATAAVVFSVRGDLGAAYVPLTICAENGAQRPSRQWLEQVMSELGRLRAASS